MLKETRNDVRIRSYLFNVVLVTVPLTYEQSFLSLNTKSSTGLDRFNNITFFVLFPLTPKLVATPLTELHSITDVFFFFFSIPFWNCRAFSREHLSH